MIDVNGLTRFYGEKRAISDVTFHVNKGEILGMLGPNGAGKTTTMRILTCYMPPTAGTATVGGFDILEQSLDVRRITGYLPENPPLYHDFRVTDYLDFVARIKGVEKARRAAEIDKAIEKANLGDVQRRIIGKLSKGYRQRVGLAQSLLNNPQIVVLDEPTEGLDPNQKAEFRELVKGLAGEHTVILSSHILPEIEQTCERVVIIDDGKVVAEDSLENLVRSIKGSERILLQIDGAEDQVRKALGAVQDAQNITLTTKNGICHARVESSKDIRSALAKATVENGLGLLELSGERYTLEDVFTKLTMKEEAA